MKYEKRFSLYQRKSVPVLLCLLFIFGMLPSASLHAQELSEENAAEVSKPEKPQPGIPEPENTDLPEETALPEETVAPEAVSTNGDFTVDYGVVSQWEQGYTVSLKITNTGEKPSKTGVWPFPAPMKSEWGSLYLQCKKAQKGLRTGDKVEIQFPEKPKNNRYYLNSGNGAVEVKSIRRLKK